MAQTKFWPSDDGWTYNHTVSRGDRLLLLLRKYEGFLGGQRNLPGGKLDAGEEPVEATVCELREKVGLYAAEVSEFTYCSNPDLDGENFRFHTMAFLVREADDTQSVQLGGKHPEFKWVIRGQFDELLVAQCARCVLGDVEWGIVSTHHGESD